MIPRKPAVMAASLSIPSKKFMALGTSTSSPAPTPSASSAGWRAAVPELTATAPATPSRAAIARSNSSTRGPWAIWPEATGGQGRLLLRPQRGARVRDRGGGAVSQR